MAERMPALFIGHGNPMNALLVNPYTHRWAVSVIHPMIHGPSCALPFCFHLRLHALDNY